MTILSDPNLKPIRVVSTTDSNRIKSYARTVDTAVAKGTQLVAAANAAAATDVIYLAAGTYDIASETLSPTAVIVGSGIGETILVSAKNMRDIASTGLLLKLRSMTLQSADSNDLFLNDKDPLTAKVSIPAYYKRDRTRIWGEYFDDDTQWTKQVSADATISQDTTHITDGSVNDYAIKYTSNNTAYRYIQRLYSTDQDLTGGTGNAPIIAFRAWIDPTDYAGYSSIIVRFGNTVTPTASQSTGQWMDFTLHSYAQTGSSSGWVDFAFDMEWAIAQSRYKLTGNTLPFNPAAVRWIQIYFSRVSGTASLFPSFTLCRLIAIPRVTVSAATKWFCSYCDDGSSRMLPLIHSLNQNGIRVAIPVRLNHMGLTSTIDAEDILSVDQLHILQDAGNYICFQSYALENPYSDGYSYGQVRDDVILASKIARELGFKGWHHWVPQQSYYNQDLALELIRDGYISSYRVTGMASSNIGTSTTTCVIPFYDPAAVWATPQTGTLITDAATQIGTHGGGFATYQHETTALQISNQIAIKALGLTPLTPDELPAFFAAQGL